MKKLDEKRIAPVEYEPNYYDWDGLRDRIPGTYDRIKQLFGGDEHRYDTRDWNRDWDDAFNQDLKDISDRFNEARAAGDAWQQKLDNDGYTRDDKTGKKIPGSDKPPTDEQARQKSLKVLDDMIKNTRKALGLIPPGPAHDAMQGYLNNLEGNYRALIDEGADLSGPGEQKVKVDQGGNVTIDGQDPYK